MAVSHCSGADIGRSLPPQETLGKRIPFGVLPRQTRHGKHKRPPITGREFTDDIVRRHAIPNVPTSVPGENDEVSILGTLKCVCWVGVVQRLDWGEPKAAYFIKSIIPNTPEAAGIVFPGHSQCVAGIQRSTAGRDFHAGLEGRNNVLKRVARYSPHGHVRLIQLVIGIGVVDVMEWNLVRSHPVLGQETPARTESRNDIRLPDEQKISTGVPVGMQLARPLLVHVDQTVKGIAIPGDVAVIYP